MTTHEIAAVDPAVYDGYVGHYQFAPVAIMTITRDGKQIFTRLTGQGPVEIFPSSKTEFFAKVVNAQISFQTDSQGKATALVLHQNGRDQTAPRMDDQAAEQIEATLRARVQSQVPTPGSDAALRALFASLLAGKPNYDQMGPRLAEATRTQLAQLEAGAQHYGAIQSLDFRGVGNMGEDVYEVHHEHGISRWRIALSPDGKVQSALFTAGP